jgi:beta-1,4-N-acetylglucosaminyltransferase
MIFLTVGTQFPFDRLVQAVDRIFEKGLIDEEIFAQIGKSSYSPRNFEGVACLEKKVFDKRFMEASGIISHAGMGTITMALDNRKPLLVVPRSTKYGEVVNNHQITIARKLEELGYILVAYGEKDLQEKIDKLKFFVPRHRENQAKAVINRITKFLDELNHDKE